MLTDVEQEVSLDSVSSEVAVKPRTSWIELKMTEHLVQTLYRLYSIAKVSSSF